MNIQQAVTKFQKHAPPWTCREYFFHQVIVYSKIIDTPNTGFQRQFEIRLPLKRGLEFRISIQLHNYNQDME